jgi:hypothetical protein
MAANKPCETCAFVNEGPPIGQILKYLCTKKDAPNYLKVLTKENARGCRLHRERKPGERMSVVTPTGEPMGIVVATVKLEGENA